MSGDNCGTEQRNSQINTIGQRDWIVFHWSAFFLCVIFNGT